MGRGGEDWNHSMISGTMDLAGVGWGWWEGINKNSIKIIEVWSGKTLEKTQMLSLKNKKQKTKQQNVALSPYKNYKSFTELATKANPPVTQSRDWEEYRAGSQVASLRQGIEREQHSWSSPVKENWGGGGAYSATAFWSIFPEAHPVPKTQTQLEIILPHEAMFICHGKVMSPFYSFILNVSNNLFTD